MEILIGWGALLLALTVVGLIIRAAGPAGRARPHCGADHGQSAHRPGGGCH